MPTQELYSTVLIKHELKVGVNIAIPKRTKWAKAANKILDADFTHLVTKRRDSHFK